MKEILSNVNGGILIDPLKPKEIAKAILLLLQNPKVRVEMGNNNRQKIRAWPQDIIRKVEEYYSATISSKISRSISLIQKG
jgi:glycosyltransferase involved in cell wall biosynthesis